MQAGQYDSGPDISSPDTGRHRLRGFLCPGKAVGRKRKEQVSETNDLFMPDPIGGSASAEPEGIDHEDFREPSAPRYEADVLMASAEGSGDVPASDTKKKSGGKASEKKKTGTK